MKVGFELTASVATFLSSFPSKSNLCSVMSSPSAIMSNNVLL